VKLLTTPAAIRAAIRQVLSDPRDERVVAVAYVGADACDYIPSPSGLRVFCWPQPGGTNPHGVAALRKAGADVDFVDRLHAKVFWSRQGGTILGSPNLSSNALGEAGLVESAIWLPPGAVDIESFLASLSHRTLADFTTKLQWLYQAHVRFAQRNALARQAGRRRQRLRTFDEWAADDARPEWRLGTYEVDEAPPDDAVRALEEETGSSRFVTYRGTMTKNSLAIGVFTLECRITASRKGIRLTQLNWWAPAARVPTRVKEWREFPHVWFARRRIPGGTHPPFELRSTRFRRALTKAIDEAGGLRWLNELEESSLRPSRAFIQRMLRVYERLNPTASRGASD
jgi:hypothetical protein